MKIRNFCVHVSRFRATVAFARAGPVVGASANRRRHRFDLYISELVLREAGRGDHAAAAKRLTELASIEVLDLDEDALHVAVATAQGMDFLLTWNYRHIANAEVIERLEAVCFELGIECPPFAHQRS